VLAIRFVAPVLDLRIAGANAVGEEGEDISNTAMVEIYVAGATESKGEGVGGMPLLEPCVTDAVEGKGEVVGNKDRIQYFRE
jgi:hypothetical protein